MSHAVLSIKVKPIDPGRDIVVSELDDIGFDGFLETEDGVDAYIIASAFDEEAFTAVMERVQKADFEVGYTYSEEEERNWNEEWEKNFDPVEVKDLCRIRAPFHEPDEGFRQEVVIMPRMSFGTGHHATTSLMVEFLMTRPLESPLLDMGAGTAVLAILARKLGVKQVTAIDIDQWAVDNAKDNCELNAVNDIDIRKGDASLLGSDRYRTILANINRNVLLEDIPVYTGVLESGGQLFLSGFYTEDLEMIRERASSSGLKYAAHLEKQNWVAVCFEKP